MQTVGKPVSLGDKLVVGALAIAFHMRESPGQALIQFLNTLARASQRSILVRIGREGPRWMHQRHQHQQCDGRLNRGKSAIRPSGPWIPAELAAARELYEAAQEGHIYVYSQSRYIQSEELRWLGRDLIRPLDKCHETPGNEERCRQGCEPLPNLPFRSLPVRRVGVTVPFLRKIPGLALSPAQRHAPFHVRA